MAFSSRSVYTVQVSRKSGGGSIPDPATVRTVSDGPDPMKETIHTEGRDAMEERMKQAGRRRFLAWLAKGTAFASIAMGPFACLLSRAWGATKRLVVPKGTDRKSLVNRNPADLDTSQLELTPLEQFDVMGLSDHQEDMSTWRLEVKGDVAKPLSLTYDQIKQLPHMEKEVLLLCPGFFANNGKWKGVSLKELLMRAEIHGGLDHVIFRGPRNNYGSVRSFPSKDVEADKVFLAYQVNGQDLPVRNGFPLRVVAQDYYGSDWVKYVYEMEVKSVAPKS